MDIVINASPLILLHRINRLHLLNELFDTVYIPSAVLSEIQVIGKTKINLDNITYEHLKVSNTIAILGLLGRLHIGEVEVMVGALERNIKIVALDDNAARNKARQLGLNVTGTLGIILAAYKKGLISDLKREIANLKNAGMYLSDDVISKILFL